MIPFPQNSIPRIWTLTNALCEGAITEQELQELELLLETDPNAKEFYIDFININAEISWLISAKQHSAMDLGPRSPVDSLVAPPNRSPILGFLGNFADFLNHHSPISYMLLVVLFTATLTVSTYLLSARQSGKAAAEPEFIAKITVTKDCQWSTAISPPAEEMLLQAGRQLQLEKGIAQITYSNGAVVLLEGPVSFTVGSPNSGFLSQGKLTAQANTEKSRQFTILTPDARFVDLGTEFGVMIDDNGRAEVAIFSGKVHAEAKLADGRWDTPVALSEGEAVVCEGRKFIPFVAQRNNFPTLHPLPPPPPDPSYLRWLEASREMQKRQDLVAYYDFQPDPNNPKVLVNRAPSGDVFNGEIQNAIWTEGRFPVKRALDFTATGAGVRVNLPGEHKQMTLIAWINSKQFVNSYNCLLFSDTWNIAKKLHWQINKKVNSN